MKHPPQGSASSRAFLKNRGKLYPALEASPHLRQNTTSSNRIMLDVLIALLPAVIGSVYLFGIDVLPLYGVAILVSTAINFLFQFFRGQALRLDLSTLVSGTLLAMSLPSTLPVWYVALGMAFGTVVGREIWGGIGRNFLNPALLGRALLRIAFPAQVLQNPVPTPPFGSGAAIDSLTGATPLMDIKAGSSLSLGQLWESFVGTVPGKLGETSALLLLIGAFYLMARGVIRMRIPVAMLGTIALLAFVLGGPDGLFSANWTMVVGHLLGGASILGAFYMATDYGSSPSDPRAQVIFGIFLGFNIMLWRLYSPWSEGFTFALLTANLLVPLLNRTVRPRVVGERRGKKQGA